MPAALEILDQRTIAAVEDSVYAAGLPRDAGAVLYLHTGGLPALFAYEAAIGQAMADADAADPKPA